MSGHTPGPWTVSSPPKDEHALDVRTPTGVLMHRGFWGHQADAHLIAAAPDLLHALQWHAEQVYAILSSDLGGDIPSRIIAATEHVQAWRDAIAKAEGQ